MLRNLWILIIATFMFLTLISCDQIFSTSINKILQSPRDYSGKQVTVSGTVVDIFSFVVVKCFVVQDDTGQITVVSDKPLPSKGQKIKVCGTVQDAFSFGDKQLIVLIEKPDSSN